MLGIFEIALKVLVDKEKLEETGVAARGDNEPGSRDREEDEDTGEPRHLADVWGAPFQGQPRERDAAGENQRDRSLREGSERKCRRAGEHPEAAGPVAEMRGARSDKEGCEPSRHPEGERRVGCCEARKGEE